MATKSVLADEAIKNQIIEAIQDKKGKDIVHIDLKEIENIPCQEFVICCGNSQPQVKAIAEEIEKQVFEKIGELPFRKEGVQYQEWIILDYFNIVVHVFLPEKRNFYNLEQLWSDGKKTTYQEII